MNKLDAKQLAFYDKLKECAGEMTEPNEQGVLVFRPHWAHIVGQRIAMSEAEVITSLVVLMEHNLITYQRIGGMSSYSLTKPDM